MNDVRRYQLIAILAAALALTVAFVRPKETSAPTNNTPVNTNTTTNTAVNSNANANTNSSVITGSMFYTADLPEADSAFQFNLKLMSGWAAEYVSADKSILIFNPTADGELRDQMSISYYHGSDFAAAAGAVVGDTEHQTIAGKSARLSHVTPTADTTISWGAATHTEVDVKAPAGDLYYRFDFAPTLSAEVITALMDSLNLSE